MQLLNIGWARESVFFILQKFLDGRAAKSQVEAAAAAIAGNK